MFKIKPLKRLKTSLQLGGDKSISHRAIILSSLSEKEIRILNFLDSLDTLTTLEAFQELGVNIKYRRAKKEVILRGNGKYLNPTATVLQMRESGTTIRLLAGLLSAQKFSSRLVAYPSLNRRPMKRITQPLRSMGAHIRGRVKDGEEYPPLRIDPVESLKAINYQLPLPSAQVKSCLLLAGLFAQGETTISEPFKSRDHTERMLKAFGADIRVRGRIVSIKPSQLKPPSLIFIPSDFSSASFFIALALLTPSARLLLKNVSLNPTRIGFLKVVKRMGGVVKLKSINKNYFEPYADILVERSLLRGVRIEEREIPLLIDELPLVFVLASFAKGKSQIYGLKELRVKETDRIKSMEYNLKRMGVNFSVRDFINSRRETDLMVEIEPPQKFRESVLKSFSDHRTAMSLIVANLALGREAFIDDVSCIDKSFPQFLDILRSLDK